MGNQNSRPFTRPVRIQIGDGFDVIAKKPSHAQRRIESWLKDYKDQTLRVYHETPEDYDRIATDIVPEILQRKYNGQITLQHLQPRVRDRALEQARQGASDISSLPLAAAESFLRQNKWIRYALNARSVFGRSGVGYFPPNYNAPSSFSMQGPAPIAPPAYPLSPAASNRNAGAVGPLVGSAVGTAAAVMIDPVAAVVIGAAAVGIYSYTKYLEGKKMYVLELQPVPNLPLQGSQATASSSSLPLLSSNQTDTLMSPPYNTPTASVAPSTAAIPLAIGAAAPLALSSQLSHSQPSPIYQGSSVINAPPIALPFATPNTAAISAQDLSVSRQIGPMPNSSVPTQPYQLQSAQSNVGIPIYDRVPVGTFIHPSTLLGQQQQTQPVSQPNTQPIASPLTHNVIQPTIVTTTDTPTPNEWPTNQPITIPQQAPTVLSNAAAQAPSVPVITASHQYGVVQTPSVPEAAIRGNQYPSATVISAPTSALLSSHTVPYQQLQPAQQLQIQQQLQAQLQQQQQLQFPSQQHPLKVTSQVAEPNSFISELGSNQLTSGSPSVAAIPTHATIQVTTTTVSNLDVASRDQPELSLSQPSLSRFSHAGAHSQPNLSSGFSNASSASVLASSVQQQQQQQYVPPAAFPLPQTLSDSQYQSGGRSLGPTGRIEGEAQPIHPQSLHQHYSGGSVSQSTTTLPPLDTSSDENDSIRSEFEGQSQAEPGQSQVSILSAEGQQPSLSSKSASYASVYPHVEQELFWPHTLMTSQGRVQVSLTKQQEEAQQGEPPSNQANNAQPSANLFAPLHLWHPGQC